MKTSPRARDSFIDPRNGRPYLSALSSLTAAVLTVLYPASSRAAPAPAEDALQEVVVTASRRAVSAQDLPISITAVTGASLDQAGIQDISGLAHSVAGVNVTDKGPFGGVNGSTLIIRGLNSEATAGQLALASPVVPPVATYVDETPLFVNLRLLDLDHVEILRGPQGTLYGSGSLGGTIRFVQNAPDPKAFDAKGEVTLSKTEHTHALNEDVNGMLNLPFSDTFAVRLNASWTDDAGFINQPNLYALDSSGAPLSAQPGNLFSPPQKYSQDGVNSYQYRTARVAALWKPNDDFKAQLSYFYQTAAAGGFPYIATSPAAYNQPIAQPPGLLPQLYDAPVPAGVDRLSSSTNSLESTKDKVDLVALTLDYDMGFATLTSSSSYAHHNNQTNSDLTALYTNFIFYKPYYGLNPRSFIQGHDQFNDKLWSQEIRLASKTGGTFDWVGGLFYKDQTTDIREHEFYPGYNDYFNACLAAGNPVSNGAAPFTPCGFGEYVTSPGAMNPVKGVPLVIDQAYIGDFETRFKDLAAFGEFTWHMTESWSLTGGARLFKQTLTQAQQTGLLFDGPAYIANESASDEWRRALWKINTSYQIDKTNLVYATWSQGFRRGGVNALPPGEPITDPTTGLPYVTPASLTRLQPDTADNYEVGAKGVLANRVRYSVAVYDIEWHNIQEGVQLTPLVLPAALNIGQAYSRGVEVELSANLTEHLGGQLGYTYDQTKLTSLNPLFTYPNVAVPPPAIGTPLPGTPKSSVALGLEYGHVQFAGGDWRYAINGHYQSAVIPALSAAVPTVGGYTMLDTRLSYTRSHLVGTVFVNNLTNNLGISSYTDPSIFGNRVQAVVSQPRTYGLTLGYSFKGW
ncbi:MAG TPA: TonB-dependent receptor [Steroidobacteraceae bacterium]|nr:TonB-dependent receptor [Steroidobacteraceae bacterium]